MNNISKLIIGGSALALVCSMAFAEGKGPKEERGPRPDRRPGEGLIRMLDKDGDGSVSKAEMLAHFDEVDANGDGSLSQEECEAHGKKMQEKMGEMREKMQRATPEERFALMDSNSDGFISKDEFKGPEKMFTHCDSNSDGQLSKEELEAAKGKMKKERGEGKGPKKDAENEQ